MNEMNESARQERTDPAVSPPMRGSQCTDIPPEVIKKIVAITSRGNDATVKRKKDGFKVYETKIFEK